ncbi:hypothetical protein ACFL0V_02040, partial [Nanoarchaeota archaeon]
FSVIAILSSIGFGKLIDYKHYKDYLLAGGITYAILMMLIVIFPSFWIYIGFAIAINIIDIFIKVPKRVISENLIHHIKDFSHHRIEYIVIREWFNIGFGRLSSFIVLLTAGSLVMDQMKWALILMGIAVLIETLLLRSIKKDF